MSVNFMAKSYLRYFCLKQSDRVTLQSRATPQAWLKMINTYIIQNVCHVQHSNTSSSVSKSIHLKRAEVYFKAPGKWGITRGIVWSVSHSVYLHLCAAWGKVPMSLVIFNGTVLVDIADHQA